MRQARIPVALWVTLGLLGSACGTGQPVRPGSVIEQPASCQPQRAASPAKPVAVTMWAYNDFLDERVDEFNRAQTGVRVKVMHRGDPTETANAYFGPLSQDGLPDIVQLPGMATGAAVDTGRVVPAQVCIDTTGYDLGDLLPQTLAPTKVAGTQWGMPVGFDDTEVLLYNTQAFARAHLDPAHPPSTVEQLSADARALVAAGGAHPIGALWALDSLLLSAPLTDADAGHAGRSTRATFDTDAVRQVFRHEYEMIDQHLAVGLTDDPQSDLKALGRGELAMTIHPIHDLGDVATALEQGQAPGLSIGVGPVPTAAGPGGVVVRSNSLFLSKASTPAARAAAWSFITWLEEPAQQARGLRPASSFFFPDRRSSAADPAVQARFASQPVLAEAWAVLTTSPSVPIPAVGATQVMAAYDSVLKAMLDHAATLEDALAQATHTVGAELAAYNADPVGYSRCAFRHADSSAPPARCP